LAVFAKKTERPAEDALQQDALFARPACGKGDWLGCGVLLAAAVPVPFSAAHADGAAAGFANSRDGAS
jgi:hypothetical protein